MYSLGPSQTFFQDRPTFFLSFARSQPNFRKSFAKFLTFDALSPHAPYPTKPRRERWYTRAAKNRALEPVRAEWQEFGLCSVTSSSTTRRWPGRRSVRAAAPHERAAERGGATASPDETPSPPAHAWRAPAELSDGRAKGFRGLRGLRCGSGVMGRRQAPPFRGGGRLSGAAPPTFAKFRARSARPNFFINFRESLMWA